MVVWLAEGKGLGCGNVSGEIMFFVLAGSDLCGWLGSCNEKVKPPKPEMGVHFCDPKINDFLVLFFRP